jgi:hypothetical protein
MSLNYKSIAVVGVGFGLLATATQGYITPAQEVTTPVVINTETNQTTDYNQIAVAGIGFDIMSVATEGFVYFKKRQYIIPDEDVGGGVKRAIFSYPDIKKKAIKPDIYDDYEEEAIMQMMQAFLNTRPRS